MKTRKKPKACSTGIEETDVEETTNAAYTCPICKQPFSSAASLSRHKKKHLEAESKCCPTCNKNIKCARKDNYARHVASCKKRELVNNEKEKNLHCVKCDKSFETKQHLLRHYSTKKHKGEKSQAGRKRKEKPDKVKLPKTVKRKQKKNKFEEWEDG